LQLPSVEGVIAEQVNYLIPIPGSARHSAVLLSTSIVVDATNPLSEQELEPMITLSDAIVATFAWLLPTENTHG